MGGIPGILLALCLLLVLAVVICQVAVAYYHQKHLSTGNLVARFLVAIVVVTILFTFVAIPLKVLGALATMLACTAIGAGYGAAIMPRLDRSVIGNERSKKATRYYTSDLFAGTLVAGFTIVALRPAFDVFDQIGGELVDVNSWIAITTCVALGLSFLIAFLLSRSAVKTLNGMGVTNYKKRIVFTGICMPMLMVCSLTVFVVLFARIMFALDFQVYYQQLEHLFWPSVGAVIALFPILRLTTRWALSGDSSSNVSCEITSGESGVTSRS